jgi:hypothetical protein
MAALNSPSAHETEAGAPEPEMKITPEMIRAGVNSFLAFDSRFEAEADLVQDIFRAMLRAKDCQPSET